MADNIYLSHIQNCYPYGVEKENKKSMLVFKNDLQLFVFDRLP